MIIDFHTHIFPDKIATRTIEYLSERGGIPANTDGSEAGLIESMENAGIDISVSLPVVTSPKQFESINRFALEINQKYENQKRKQNGFYPAYLFFGESKKIKNCAKRDSVENYS